MVMVWNAESHEQVLRFRNSARVGAVDVSPDSDKIVTGSDDYNACVWSLSTGKRLLVPLKHDFGVAVVKFSPDGCFFATVITWGRRCRIYDSQDGRLLVDVPARVAREDLSVRSIAWAKDSKQLFVLSRNSSIRCIDVSTGNTLSQWLIQSPDPTCIAIARNGTFIAASNDSSFSFWDTATGEQIGSVIQHTRRGTIRSLAISATNDLAIREDQTITLLGLSNILPSHYIDDVSVLTSNVRWSSERNPSGQLS